MSCSSNWSYPTNIRFGAGRISELPDACLSLGIDRPLLVTDSGLAKLPMLRNAVDACEQAGLGIDIFSDIKSNPVERNVTDGVAVLKDGGHNGVIAFRRRISFGCRQGHCIRVRPDATALGF